MELMTAPPVTNLRLPISGSGQVEGTLGYEQGKKSFRISSSPAIGADGTVYVGCGDHSLYAVDPSGKLRWSLETGDAIFFSSPAIGPDGTVYIGSNDGKLYAIHSDSAGVADSAWPMFLHDPRHTARISQPLDIDGNRGVSGDADTLAHIGTRVSTSVPNHPRTIWSGRLHL